MVECIVHFEVHERDGEVSKLRGLVMTEKGRKPTLEEVQAMLRMMEYDARADDTDHYTFVPAASGANWEKIVVKKMDTGEEVFTPDLQLKTLAESMMKQRSNPPI